MPPPTRPPPPPLSLAKCDGEKRERERTTWRPLRTALRVSVLHLKKYAGVGIVCSVAYFDPGNWSVDLQAGSQFGYKLLFVVLFAGIMAALLQAMATKLGVVTGLDLATHCRLLLYNRTSHPRLTRWLVLYPLYAACEIAIIATDLAELLGSATAINLLVPSIPLWAGVLLTTVDVLFVLALGNAGGRKPVRVFEVIIAALVMGVFICLLIVIVKVSPKWGDAFEGFLPSHTVVRPGALYISVGIIGATVMPHGLFLGSALATQDRISFKDALQDAAFGESNDVNVNANDRSNLNANSNSNGGANGSGSGVTDGDDPEDPDVEQDEKKLVQNKPGTVAGNAMTDPVPSATNGNEETEKSPTTTTIMTSRSSSKLAFRWSSWFGYTLSRLGGAVRGAFRVQRVGSNANANANANTNTNTTDDDLPDPDPNAGHDAWSNNTHAFVRAHLKHGVVDVVFSLLGLAVAINAMILILAAAVFFPSSSTSTSITTTPSSTSSSSSPASLPDAFHLISTLVGKAAAVVFALALLCAGQSASITATVAGQVVCEGFLRVRVSPVLRRLLTRLLSLLPSMVVAIVIGPKGIDTLLVLSQVVLSIVLPFAAFPLVYLTSSRRVMRVRRGGGCGGGGVREPRELSGLDGLDGEREKGEREGGEVGVDGEKLEIGIGSGSVMTALTATAVGTTTQDKDNDNDNDNDDFLQRAQNRAFSNLASSSSPSSSSGSSSPSPLRPRIHPLANTPQTSSTLNNTPSPLHTSTSTTLSSPTPTLSPTLSHNLARSHSHSLDLRHSTDIDLESRPDRQDEWIDYSNHWVTTVLGYAIWLLICIANVYVIGTFGDQ